MSEWIPVKERLPEHKYDQDNEYLVWDGKNYFIATFTSEQEWRSEEYGLIKDIYHDVTHWQELNPPK